MSRSQKGFTLIELMIVIAIIAIIAAIAIPNLLAARLSTNETAAVATLRQILASQAQFQTGARCDEDADGTGEYAGFMELSGSSTPLAPRMAAALVPPVLSTAFQNLNATGEASRSGYLFHIYLPGAAGAPVAEPTAGFAVTAAPSAIIDLRETTWCCYAWPNNYNQTGNRTFFTNQAGDILQCEVATFSGPGAGPAGDDAFSVANNITGQTAVGAAGQLPAFVKFWTQVN